MILLVLLALVARVDAAPSDASIALAVRYADVLTGVDDADAPEAPELGSATADRSSEASEAAETGETGEAGDEADETDEADEALAGDGELARAPGDTGNGEDTADGERSGGDAGQLAMLDAEQAPGGAIASDEARVAASPAGAAETYEAWMRRRVPSRWGRLDLGLVWRRRWSAPMHDSPHRSDEVWLFATWRR